MADDKQEYKKMLKVLGMTGSGQAVMNKLGDMIHDIQDPRLKQAVSALDQGLHADPETKHLKKLRLLDYAAHWGATGSSRGALAKNIYTLRDYCDQHTASLIPQWQLIASAAGWTPPSPPAK